MPLHVSRPNGFRQSVMLRGDAVKILTLVHESVRHMEHIRCNAYLNITGSIDLFRGRGELQNEKEMHI